MGISLLKSPLIEKSTKHARWSEDRLASNALYPLETVYDKHRFQHVFAELLERVMTNLFRLDGFGDLSKDRVAHLSDFEDPHGWLQVPLACSGAPNPGKGCSLV